MAQGGHAGALEQRLMLKKQAQLDREYTTRQLEAEEPKKPLFRDPVKKEHNDPLSLKIKGVLGTYEEFQSRPDINALVGAPKAPATPLAKFGVQAFPAAQPIISDTSSHHPSTNRSTSHAESLGKTGHDRKDSGLRTDQRTSRSSDHDTAHREQKAVDQKLEKCGKTNPGSISPVRIHAPSDAGNHFRQPLPKSSHDVKRHNGVINGPAKAKLPPLHIPKQKPAGSGPPELENIFQEMKSIDPPLTGIQTPRKEEAPHFQFSQNQQDKHPSKLFHKDSLHEVEPPNKSKTGGLYKDLELSESEDEDAGKKASSPLSKEDLSRSDSKAPVTMSSSESSDGEESSSDSSEDDSGESESEAETEPASQEPANQEEPPTSWSLKNFMNDKPAEKSLSPLTPKGGVNTGVGTAKVTSSIFDDELVDDDVLSKNNQQSNDALLCQLSAQLQSVDAPVVNDDDHDKTMDELERERDDRFDNHTEMLSSPETRHLLHDSEAFKRSQGEKPEKSSAKKEAVKKVPGKCRKSSESSDRKRRTKKSHKSSEQNSASVGEKKSESVASPRTPSQSLENSGELKVKIKVGGAVEQSKVNSESKPTTANKTLKHSKVAAKSPRNVVSSPATNGDLEKTKSPTSDKKVAAKKHRRPSRGKTTPRSVQLSDSSGSSDVDQSESSSDDDSDTEAIKNKKILQNVFRKSAVTKSPNVKTTSNKVTSRVKEEVPIAKVDTARVKEETLKVKEEAPKLKEGTLKVKEDTIKLKEEAPKVKERNPKVKEGTLKVKEENNNKKKYTSVKKEKPDEALLISPEALRLPDPMISPIYDKNMKNGDSMMPSSIVVKLDLQLVQELLGQPLNTKRKSLSDGALGSDGESGRCDSSDDNDDEQMELCDKAEDGASQVKSEPNISERLSSANVKSNSVKTISSNDDNHERTRVDSLEQRSESRAAKSDVVNDVKVNASKDIPNLPKIPKRKRPASVEREERSRSHSRESDVKRRKSSTKKEKEKHSSKSSKEVKRESTPVEGKRSSSSSRHKSRSKDKELPVKKESEKHGKDRKSGSPTLKTESDAGSIKKEVKEGKRESSETNHVASVKKEVKEEKMETSEICNVGSVKKEVVEEKWESSEFYRRKGKALKHEADAMSGGVSKMIKCLEAILSFIMCAGAMERDPAVRSQQTFDMYEGTMRLISHYSRYRAGSNQASKNKKLQVLGLRLHAFITHRLYKIKRTELRNLKKVIDDHSKMQQTTPIQAPSPYGAWNKGGAGTPSPMSPSPSPGSTGSQGSFNGDARPSSSVAPAGHMPSPGTISVPQRIHSATNSYITYTHYLVQSHDYWEQADMHSLDCADFFADVDNQCGKLTINGNSITQYVNYVRYAIKKLKESS